MEINKPKTYNKSVKSEVSLLSGLLVCKNCGSFMRPLINASTRRDAEGNRTFTYNCELRRKSKKSRCSIANLNGNTLDKMVCNEILQFDIDGTWMKEKLSFLRQQMKSGGSISQVEINALKERLEGIERDKETCFNVFSTSNVSSEMVEMANEKMKKLGQEKVEIDKRLFQLEEERKLSVDFGNQVDIITDALKHFRSTFYTASIHDKRLLLRAIIEKIEWDGKDIHIFLFGESA